MIKCPYCLVAGTPTLEHKGNKQVYICSNCKEEVHRDFVEEIGTSRANVGVIGFSGHGKTVFITSLFYLLKVLARDMEGNVWNRFTYHPLDGNTLKVMFENVPKFESSRLPQATPENFPSPSLCLFRGIPSFGDRFLSFYDMGGNVFEDPELIVEKGMYVAHSQVVLFVISVNDCGDNWDERANRMETLLGIYWKAAHDELRGELRQNQHLIVVLTKADKVNMPREIERYLQLGSVQSYGMGANCDAFNRQMQQLQEISKNVRLWLSRCGCGGFVKSAKKNFKSVEYCIVSATGAEPIGDQLATRLQPGDPKCVLDPYLWMLKKTRRRFWQHA